MKDLRFILTLLILLAVFIGGGFIVDHWNKIETTTTAEVSPAAVSTPAALPEVAEAAAADGAAAPKAETRMREEFDAQAADAAAEAEAQAAIEAQGAASSAQTRATRSLTPELVSLDAVRLSADSASVIAGQAPAGAEVTLLANGQALGVATSDESGAWTIVLDEPVVPGTYKLALSAVEPGGTPVVREVGEATVALPEVAAALVSGETGAGETKPAESTAAAAPEAIEPATETDAVAVIVPAPAFELAGIPPDLAAPAPAAVSESADAIADADGVTVVSPSDAASAPAPVEMAENSDGSLTEQAGEVADSISDMFTDWLNATKEQAEEAAKTFTLASAGYKAIGGDLGVITLSGRGPAKAKVQVLVDKQVVGSTEIAESGRWLLEVPQVLAPGPHTMRAEILAADGTLIVGRDQTVMGETAPEIVAAAPATSTAGEAATSMSAPLVVSGVTYESMGPKQGRVTVSGRAEAGASIAVVADGARIGMASADPEGNWAVRSDTWLDVGAHAIRAEQMGPNGEVAARTLSEFVREATAIEVAAAAPEPPAATATSEANMVAVAEQAPRAKPRKRSARVHLRKRAKIASKSAKTGKRATRKAATPPKNSGYHIVNVHKGKELSRVRVRMPGRKGRVVSFMVPKGPGWVRARQGDSLWRIADKWYGSGRSYPVIAGFNNQRVLDPDRIRARQRLRVP